MPELTTLKLARDAVEAKWITDWATTTPYCFDNENFDPPALGTVTAQNLYSACWCRLVVRNRFSTKETLGAAPRFERWAAIMIQVFVPVDTGRTDSDTLAQTARAVFEGLSFSGVKCHPGNVREAGVDGRWYQVNVEIPFTYYETVTT